MNQDCQLKIGLEVLRDRPSLADDWGRCALLCNQASVTRDFVHSRVILQEALKGRLTQLFGPQHGFYGTAQDNMIETDHEVCRETGLPIHSLYSETREPTERMLHGIETVVIDLQIVGCRIYTWKSTIAGCLRSAKKFNKRVIILDRPNPVGGKIVEGNVLEPDASSFVGQFPIPMRHGLSAGEAALFFNETIEAELDVIKLENWEPEQQWNELNRPWVLTSPNLPTAESMFVYPGTVIFEGTNLSEGRGTGLPFQFIGAPYIPNEIEFVARIQKILGGAAPGLYLRPVNFEPTFHKWAGKLCRGVQLHVLEPAKIRSFQLALAILKASMDLGEGEFEWKKPPYEYDLKTLPMKLILGTHDFEKELGSNFDVRSNFWSRGISEYCSKAQAVMLYPRSLVFDSE